MTRLTENDEGTSGAEGIPHNNNDETRNNSNESPVSNDSSGDDKKHRKWLEDLGYGIESFHTIIRPGMNEWEQWETNRRSLFVIIIMPQLLKHCFVLLSCSLFLENKQYLPQWCLQLCLLHS